METKKTTRAPQLDDKFVLRLPDGMREQIALRAKENNRSMNAEIIGRLQQSLEAVGAADLSAFPAGVLLDEVIERYGARLQIVVSKDVAEKAGIGAASKPAAKRRV